MGNISKPVSRRDLLRGVGAVVATSFLEQPAPGSSLAETTSPPATIEPQSGATTYRGKWHDKKRCFGFHHDLHVVPSDRDIGTHCSPEELIPMLKLTGADFVQTDCKGHPGLTSWFSKTPGASVGPGVVKDALEGWRRRRRHSACRFTATIPASMTGPPAPSTPNGASVAGRQARRRRLLGTAAQTGDRMCPRSAYLDELMIPQMLELIDRYGVDGFWIDGDLWAVEPCYCERCRAAFTQKTGIAEPPKGPDDPNWAAWWNFTRESFEEYVTRYCDAVHRHKPGVLVCSNWLQTFRHPGEPKVPTDWISGDNTWVWGLDGSRCEARFISTRGKPWDIMLWCFYSPHGQFGRPDWQMKPVEMLQQEAAVMVAFGGNVQTCEYPGGLRTGQLIPWRLKRIGEVAEFVKRRRACARTRRRFRKSPCCTPSTMPERATSGNLMWVDVAPVQGAVFSLLECHYGVDILDEWALAPRLARFPVVVVPEQDRLSEKMVNALKEYVRGGGKLLVSGAESFDRFGGEFLGVKEGRLVANSVYHVPAADGTVPILSDPWRLIETTSARSLGPIGTTPLRDDHLLPHPAATLNRVGRGAVAYVPCNVFRDFTASRYPLARVFIHDVLRALAGPMEIEVNAPACVDVVLRRQGARAIVHLINRSSGIPSLPNSGVIDEIQPAGPVTITMSLPGKPKNVHLAFEDAAVKWACKDGPKGGQLSVDVAAVHIHAAVIVEAKGEP